MLKIGVLVSGGGTNLQAIMDAIDAGEITNAEIGCCDQQQHRVLMRWNEPENMDIEAMCISPKDYADREEFHKALLCKTSGERSRS